MKPVNYSRPLPTLLFSAGTAVRTAVPEPFVVLTSTGLTHPLIKFIVNLLFPDTPLPFTWMDGLS